MKHCVYGPLREQMIHDRLVVGLLDHNLSERLQLESDLKLVGTVQKACNSKTVKSQQATIWGPHTLAAVDAESTRHRLPKGKQSRHSHNENGGTYTSKQQ